MNTITLSLCAPWFHGLVWFLSLAIVPAIIAQDPAGSAEAAPSAQVPQAGKEVTLDLGNGAQLTLVPIPAGSFTMGSPENESNRKSDEGPQTRVTISRPFWMGRTEVTQGQWEVLMGDNPSEFKGDASLPVENVSWEDAMGFCRKLTERERAAGRLPEGYEYILPTEAQWEYACHAGTSGPFHYGDSLDASMANFDGNYPYGSGRKGEYRLGTIAVGSFRPNAWGLYDMHGNVWEWCRDYYGDYPGGDVTDPTGPSSGTCRVLRGGAFNSFAESCRSAYRGFNMNEPGFRCYLLGFRLVLAQTLADASYGGAGGARARQEQTQAAARQQEAAPKQAGPEAGQTWTIPDINLTLVLIPAGTFTMGSPDSENDRNSDEGPQTRVTISRPFWMGKTEVTQGQWQGLMGSNLSHFKGENLPVENVSWEDAMGFCRKLTERERAAGRLPEGYEYTLPTEAQWEYACRAGMRGAYAGSGNLDSMGWYNQNSGNTTNPVGQKQANAWGLYDMHGNVWEWCRDCYESYPGGSVTDPTGPSSGSIRVYRGGGWGSDAVDCRSANRSGSIGPDLLSVFLGFRLAILPPVSQ